MGPLLRCCKVPSVMARNLVSGRKVVVSVIYSPDKSQGTNSFLDSKLKDCLVRWQNGSHSNHFFTVLQLWLFHGSPNISWSCKNYFPFWQQKLRWLRGWVRSEICCWLTFGLTRRKFDAKLTQVWRRSRFVLMQFSTWIFKNIFVPRWSQAVSRKIWFTSNLTRHAKNSSRKFIGGEVLTKNLFFIHSF